MSAPLVLRQYWQLTRTLMFPLRVTRWLTVGTLVLALLGGLLFWWAEHPVVLIISGAIASTILILVGIMVPAQMLSLASSKQLFWIPDLRRKTFFILFFLYGLTALLVSLLLAFKPNAVPVIIGVSVAFTFVATLAALMLIASVYFQSFQPFMFVLIWGFYFFAEKFLLSSALINFASGCLIWSALYLWWTRWIPHKYFLNYMTVSPAKLREAKEQQAGVVQSFAYWASSTPRSLCGTLLSGASDGFKSRLKYEFGQLIVVLLMVLIFTYFFRDVSKDGFLKIIPFIALTFMASRNVQIQLLCYRHLHRIWMFYHGSRMNLFYYLEKQYALSIGLAYGALVLGMLIVNFQLGSKAAPISMLFFVLATGGLFTVQLFYVGWIIYQKTAASMVWLGWITGIITSLFLALVALLDIFWMPNFIQNPDYYWIFIGIMLAVLMALRFWALNSWSTINFYRVRN